MSEYEDDKDKPATPAPIEKKDKPKRSGEDISEVPTEKLEVMLNNALSQEDYEKAAHIRDELQKRGKVD